MNEFFLATRVPLVEIFRICANRPQFEAFKNYKGEIAVEFFSKWQKPEGVYPKRPEI
jgi:hypothetical protein